MLYPKVTVYEESFSYDVINLVVDLGSALGLWLGLSALSILDYILTFWNTFKKKF